MKNYRSDPPMSTKSVHGYRFVQATVRFDPLDENGNPAGGDPLVVGITAQDLDTISAIPVAKATTYGDMVDHAISTLLGAKLGRSISLWKK